MSEEELYQKLAEDPIFRLQFVFDNLGLKAMDRLDALGIAADTKAEAFEELQDLPKEKAKQVVGDWSYSPGRGESYTQGLDPSRVMAAMHGDAEGTQPRVMGTNIWTDVIGPLLGGGGSDQEDPSQLKQQNRRLRREKNTLQNTLYGVIGFGLLVVLGMGIVIARKGKSRGGAGGK